jgi:hypothetical protein
MTAETILAIGAGVRAAPAPLLPGTGDSFTLRSQDTNKKLFLFDILINFAVSSNVIIKSARMHDNVNGINIPALAASPVLPNLRYVLQPMIQQDNLSVIGGIGGGAATFDNALISFFYEDLIGAPGNLQTQDYVISRLKNILTVPIGVTPSAIGDWSAGAALNSTVDLLKANTNYAVLGAWCDASSGAIAISGPCTGNVKFAAPTQGGVPYDGSSYFIDISHKTGLPLIPVLNSADKGGTFVYVTDVAATMTLAYLALAELGG